MAIVMEEVVVVEIMEEIMAAVTTTTTTQALDLIGGKIKLNLFEISLTHETAKFSYIKLNFS